MGSSVPAQIPQDHSHKQLLFDMPSPALTVAWSPPSSLLHESLLAVGHAQGVSLYRQLSQPEQDLDSSSHALDRAEAFRIRWGLEPLCDGTLGTDVRKISWAPTSTYKPSSDSNITLLTLSSDHAARIIEFPSEGGTQLNVLGGTSGHRSFINAIDSIIHPRATVPTTNHDLVIATAGDDSTLIVWQWEETSDQATLGFVPAAYALSSPGVAVEFCRHFPKRLIVAEEEGTIRLLDWAVGSEARVSSSSGFGSGTTLWLLNVHMGVGLSLGTNGLLVNAEWCGDDVDGQTGRIVAVTKGGEWAVWDLSRIEGGGRTVPIEQGQVVRAKNVVAIRSHPSEPTLFAIASKATHETHSLHVVDLTLEHQTYPHPIFSLPTSTITPTSLSWHPTEAVLAVTLSSGALLITRVNERSDGEKQDPKYPGSYDVVLRGHEDDDEEEEEEEEEESPEDEAAGESTFDVSFDNSFASRRGEEMALDHHHA